MVVYLGYEFELKPPFIDLRLVKKRMMDNAKRKDYGLYDPAFTAAFSRAVRSLVERKLLWPCNGQGSREIRFVTVTADEPSFS